MSCIVEAAFKAAAGISNMTFWRRLPLQQSWIGRRAGQAEKHCAVAWPHFAQIVECLGGCSAHPFTAYVYQYAVRGDGALLVEYRLVGNENASVHVVATLSVAKLNESEKELLCR